jgi:hypothetical protein
MASNLIFVPSPCTTILRSKPADASGVQIRDQRLAPSTVSQVPIEEQAIGNRLGEIKDVVIAPLTKEFQVSEELALRKSWSWLLRPAIKLTSCAASCS